MVSKYDKLHEKLIARGIAPERAEKICTKACKKYCKYCKYCKSAKCTCVGKYA